VKALVIQHADIEGAGLIGEMFDDLGWSMDVREMYRPGVSLPGDLNDHQALVILGGPMGADDEDDYPYLAEVKNLIRLAVDRRIPTLGICLGGQLIARALGAKVRPKAATEIGWFPVRLTDSGRQAPLFHGLPDEFMVFQWHNDTFDLPPGASHLAASVLCRHQAFSYGEHVWALQFHLEITPAMIEEWVAAYADELKKIGGREASRELLERTKQLWPKQQQQSGRFLYNLGNLLQKLLGNV